MTRLNGTIQKGSILEGTRSAFRSRAAAARTDASYFMAYHFDQLVDIRDIYIPILMCVLVFVLNAYLIFCLKTVRSLNSWKFFLVGWQCFCDITSVGLGETLAIASRFLYPIRRPNPSPTKLFVLHFLPQFFQLINASSTAAVLVFFAIERAILIMFPFRRVSLLSDKMYRNTSVLIVTANCAHWAVFVAIICIQGFTDRDQGFLTVFSVWESEELQKWVPPIVKFFGPAALTLLVYVGIAVRFLQLYLVRMKRAKMGQEQPKLTSKDRRNIQLTVAFLSSVICWIGLWSLYYWGQSVRMEGDWRHYDWVRMFMFAGFNRHLFNLYSIVNPAIFITINRSFHKPIKQWVSKCVARIGCGKRSDVQATNEPQPNSSHHITKE